MGCAANSVFPTRVNEPIVGMISTVFDDFMLLDPVEEMTPAPTGITRSMHIAGFLGEHV